MPLEALTDLFIQDNPEFRVLGIDPGGTTGWALFQVPTNCLIDRTSLITDSVQSWTAGQFGGPEITHVDNLMKLVIEDPAPHHIVIEDFILQQFRQDRNLLSPVRVTSMMEYALHGLNRTFTDKQMPSLAKTTYSDARLKAANFYHLKNGSPHARDGVRHCLTYLKRLKQANLEARTIPGR